MFLPSTIIEDKLSDLAILSIEKCTAEKMYFDKPLKPLQKWKKDENFYDKLVVHCTQYILNNFFIYILYFN